jgi:hypothetical protein
LSFWSKSELEERVSMELLPVAAAGVAGWAHAGAAVASVRARIIADGFSVIGYLFRG